MLVACPGQLWRSSQVKCSLVLKIFQEVPELFLWGKRDNACSLKTAKNAAQIWMSSLKIKSRGKRPECGVWSLEGLSLLQDTPFPWGRESRMRCSAPFSIQPALASLTGLVLGHPADTKYHGCSSPLLESSIGGLKSYTWIFKCQRVGATNPHVVQGSAVLFHTSWLCSRRRMTSGEGEPPPQDDWEIKDWGNCRGKRPDSFWTICPHS